MEIDEEFQEEQRKKELDWVLEESKSMQVPFDMFERLGAKRDGKRSEEAIHR